MQVDRAIEREVPIANNIVFVKKRKDETRENPAPVTRKDQYDLPPTKEEINNNKKGGGGEKKEKGFVARSVRSEMSGKFRSRGRRMPVLEKGLLKKKRSGERIAFLRLEAIGTRGRGWKDEGQDGTRPSKEDIGGSNNQGGGMGTKPRRGGR